MTVRELVIPFQRNKRSKSVTTAGRPAGRPLILTFLRYIEVDSLRASRSARSHNVNPSPPGPLSAWGGGGSRPPPQLSREPLVVESRARRHSKALRKTRQNHLSELNIEVTCEVKVRSKVKIWRFEVLGPGDQDYRT